MADRDQSDLSNTLTDGDALDHFLESHLDFWRTPEDLVARLLPEVGGHGFVDRLSAEGDDGLVAADLDDVHVRQNG